MIITRRNALTGFLEDREIPITPEQWERYVSGEALRKVAPELSTDDLRFIVYGVNEHQYGDMFGD